MILTHAAMRISATITRSRCRNAGCSSSYCSFARVFLTSAQSSARIFRVALATGMLPRAGDYLSPRDIAPRILGARGISTPSTNVTRYADYARDRCSPRCTCRACETRARVTRVTRVDGFRWPSRGERSNTERGEWRKWSGFSRQRLYWIGDRVGEADSGISDYISPVLAVN